jgi:hypothetical protein
MVFVGDGMIPTIPFSIMEMVKRMDVEVMNWQPPSTSKANASKTKCPTSIWFNVALTYQRQKFGTNLLEKKTSRFTRLTIHLCFSFNYFENLHNLQSWKGTKNAF